MDRPETGSGKVKTAIGGIPGDAPHRIDHGFDYLRSQWIRCTVERFRSKKQMVRRTQDLSVADKVGQWSPVWMKVHMHQSWCYNDPVAHDTQHFFQSLLDQSVRPDAIKIGKAFEQV